MRVGIRAILTDPVQRRALAVRFIMSAQAMEGIKTTRAQAEAAYDRVQEEKRIAQYGRLKHSPRPDRRRTHE